MNAKSKLLVGMMLLLGCFSTAANAQESATIKALLKKCETMESVDISTIRQRGRDSKETKETINVNIKSNPALVKEFQDAFQEAYQNDFQKSKENVASTEVIQRKGGKIVSLVYKMENISYHFSIRDDGNASVTIIKGAEGDFHFNIGGFAYNYNLEDLKLNLEEMKFFFQMPDIPFKSFEYLGNMFY